MSQRKAYDLLVQAEAGFRLDHRLAGRAGQGGHPDR